MYADASDLAEVDSSVVSKVKLELILEDARLRVEVFPAGLTAFHLVLIVAKSAWCSKRKMRVGSLRDLDG